MKNKIRLLVCLLYMGAFGTIQGQSLWMARSYLEQGQYREAAMQLRPLADDGNAEAQYLAATLFFEGKGVNKSNEQAIKYLRMSAEQGYDDARLLYAECLFSGKGTVKDYEKGWQIIVGHDKEESFKEKHGSEYWPYKMQKAGKTSLEDLAEQLYATKQTNDFNLLTTYIEINEYAQSAKRLKVRADMGNAWAMGRLAKVYFENGYKETAINWAKKSADAGSAYGKDVLKRVSYEPIVYTKPQMDSSPQSASIEKIVLEYDKTVVYIRFRDITHYYDRIYTEKGAHIQYNGARYGLLASSIPIQGNGYRKFDRGEEIHYTITFERIPTTASTVTIIDGTWQWDNIKLK